ncbi:hypothetical protein CPAST_c25230 [Clostridium pasteurianum DSM 525 = ATCC 6013]|uniref:DUF2933 domain-containing protein n=1 Tax=Clostridium pasteurianum DSM 525 = ATCC 6013 TaxID=1262449 RepID=A0A0H3J5W5_CLOPA|nr:hypothetical protein [Clostridium pasteurianum]AJA48592.1 hypothetical protein CPAST_c25230 [Clostridium pasteurianum DSM 525 = ATCC 6013]AJA52580.1 hypothetical protein CLPA_c25230 [Clostridium pasteurianum DSM 525 = ATCC 6013]AOZ75823.1 hypothetical protein AQ983_12255 [Clostridium pasteurianum DSM 525 = ATCC 6013]AOZ79619.1 hypothetical protein AQ984_12250 [Clostridium pasteurianum]ELP57930.1 hypothetical protein F502_17055 [Clostridium pasteurianum DSM 525 = ATCC 6013]
MNCHDNKNNNQEKPHSPLKHMLHMILCCAIPILLVAALPFLKLNGTLNTAILAISPLICPIMMGFMIFMMLKGSKKKKAGNENLQESTQIAKKD